MVVKVRFPEGSPLGRRTGKQAMIVNIASGLMTMSAVSCSIFAVWRVTQDLGWTEDFVITSGLFSHWQVWSALTIAFAYAAIRLSQAARVLAENVPNEHVLDEHLLDEQSAGYDTRADAAPMQPVRSRSKAASR